MNPHQVKAIFIIWDNPESQQAIRAMLRSLSQDLTTELRTAAGDGNLVRSGIAEGRARMLDELPDVFQKVAESANL